MVLLVHDDDVMKYINLPKEIKRLKAKKELIKQLRYKQNLYVHPVVEGGCMMTISVKPEKFVVDLISFEETISNLIQRCQMRYEAFNHKGLTCKEYKQLPLFEQEQIKDDCFQAETYTAYRCGYEPPTEDISADSQDSLKDIAQLFSMEVWS